MTRFCKKNTIEDKTLAGIGDLICDHRRISGKTYTTYYMIVAEEEYQPKNYPEDPPVAYFKCHNINCWEHYVRLRPFAFQNDEHYFLMARAEP